MPRKLTGEEFIERARAVYGDEYDYSRVVYRGTTKPIEIICRQHGSFWQKGAKHIYFGGGCPDCAENRTSSYWTFCSSLRVVSPACLTAEMWTKASLEPSLGSMKPYPFVGLNHLTVPVVMSRLVLSKYRVGANLWTVPTVQITQQPDFYPHPCETWG